MLDLTGYIETDSIYSGTRTIVYRGSKTSDRQPVIIKVLRNPHPNFNELVQFRNQYVIARHLEHPALVRPLALERYGNGYALVMPDEGGLSLSKYWQFHEHSLAEFIDIAIQLADALHYLIQKRIIHKDIKPSNILIHPETGKVKLMDFSISTLLPKEQQQLANPNVLEGTLAYISPEQTGRTNRGIDYRTDFYSLGITFFELLTGKLPFETTDPMELVHCHIAKMPSGLGNRQEATGNRGGEIPEVVSDIVLKLMAKNAEDRYQSALGLKYDLERCLEQLQVTGEIATFEIGTQDRSDRFIIPEKLYGRETEVQTLLDAFGRVALGATEMMLVAGFSGIGKTAVVSEVRKPIVEKRGYFIKGKFDQFNRNIPFSAFVQGFRDLMGHLLGESDADLASWKAKILEALGENGQVIIDVVPELERIVGKQPPVPELSGSAAQNRFNLLFQKFIAAFSTSKHPLAIFLDDLQWADSGSLNLIKILMGNASAGYLLLLGAYRDNEVFPAHPLMLQLEELQKEGAVISTITLEPLAFHHINRLVADTLNCREKIARPLSELLYEKTRGNPFFTTQFLKGLHEDGLIQFDRNLGYWECDLVRVRDAALTDNAVEFMASRLHKLPEKTQEILKLAACIGNQFDLGTLAVVSQNYPEETAKDLWFALQEGFLLPLSETYKFYQEGECGDKGDKGDGNTTTSLSSPSPLSSHSVLPKYKFLHDRVQQAAYSLIPEERKAITHYCIGQLLKEKIPPEAREERIFEIVGQLNYGSALITEQAERDELAQFNLIACRKARAATAYRAGREYASAGLSLLGENGWARQYEMTLALHDAGTELASISGDFEEMERLAERVISRSRCLLDRTRIYRIRILANVSQNKLTAAISIGLQFLQQLGVTFPESPGEEDIGLAIAEVEDAIADRPIEDLASLGTMSDRSKIAILEIANSIMPAAYISGSPLFPLLTALSVKLSIQYGNISFSASAYAIYGIISCNMLQNVDAGVKFCQLGLKLASELDAKTVKPEILHVMAMFILHRKFHIKEALPLSQQGYVAALEVGNLEYAGYAAQCFCINSLWSAQPLASFEREASAYCHALVRLNQLATENWCRIHWQVALNLLGATEDKTLLSGEAFSEATFLPPSIEAGDFVGLFLFYLNKLMLCYLFGEIKKANKQAVEARRYLTGFPGSIGEPVFYFYDSLTYLASLKSQSEETSEQFQRVEENQKILQEKWANYAAMNHQNKVDLVAAEKCRVLGQKIEAMELYDKAIEGAKENQLLHEEALANELAAKFYLEWGKEKFAVTYMQEAYYCYARWGAKAKTDELEAKYPQLLTPILQKQRVEFNPIDSLDTITKTLTSVLQEGTETGTHISETLDFAAILLAAQNLSSSIELDELLANIVRIILKNTGAQKTVLLVPEPEQWQMRAMARLANDGSVETSTKSQPLTADAPVPVRLVRYVKNTEKSVLINEAKTDIAGVIEGYLLEYKPQSVFCLPLKERGNLVAILYLEHPTTKGVFTRNRQTIIEFLCTQAAIALENARLYSQTKSYVKKLERSLETLQKTQSQLIRDEQIMQAQILAISNLYQSKAISSGELKTSFQELTTATARTLKVERASIWLFDEERTKIDCIDLFESSCERHSEGFELFIADNPNYFNAVNLETLLVSNDSQNDPKTSDFKDNYLVPLKIMSMLDANVLLNGKIYGILCCEQVGSKRVWTQAEQNFVRSVANLITLTLEANLRSQKEEKLERALLDLKQSQLQLVQSEKMSALGNLVAGVAHEINNPTGFLQGNITPARDYVENLLDFIDFLLAKVPSDDGQIETKIEEIDLEFIQEDLPKLLESMNVGVERIRNISKSLRTFSRKDRELKTEFNIHEGIDSTLLILQHRTKASEERPAIEIIQEYAEIPEVQCFPGQLNQVFMNILANAIDAFDEANEGKTYSEIEKNPNRITIRTAMADNWVEIQISDNGCGMKPETVGRIFEQGFTTKGVGKGTGLGMAIAHNIVTEKHGGTITCDSKLGVGTTFTIELPIL